jgi:predicted LPLAT superfamily acyltransferase
MSQWSGKSKGTVLGYKIFLFFIKFFGVSAAYLLLRFVTFYYYLFAKENRNAIFDFYTSTLHLTQKEAKKLTRQNFYIFGQTLVDRSAYLVGRGDRFTHSFDGENYLLEMNKIGKGGILLSGHLGNWETAGNLLKKRVTKKINVLMVDAEVEKIKEYLDSSTGGSHFNIIPIKNDLSHVIKIKNALDNNEFVAMHADRFLPNTKTIEMDFLGKKARFPIGPFLLASKFNAPVSIVFAIKETDFHYSLSATKPIFEQRSIEQIAKHYVLELQNKVKLNPEQWFNYYDFFNNDK